MPFHGHRAFVVFHLAVVFDFDFFHFPKRRDDPR